MPDNQCEKSMIKSTSKEISWKGLIKECLIETPIFEENGNDKNGNTNLDPNFVMDLRHEMVKESTKLFHISRTQIHCDALKLLRVKNYRRLAKQKEGRMVENEIIRLKQTLETNRFTVQKRLQETDSRIKKSSGNLTQYSNFCTKQHKRPEFKVGICKLDIFCNDSVQLEMEPEISWNKIPFDRRVTLKETDPTEDFSEAYISPKSPTPISEESMIGDQGEYLNQILEGEGKKKIVKKFFCQQTKAESAIQLSYSKNDENYERIPNIQIKMNLRRVKHAWLTWKAFVQEMKKRRSEKKMYKTKIDSFLSKLERKKFEERQEIITDDRLNGKEKIKKNKLSSREDEKNLKNIMAEVKASQAEASQRLQEIKKARLKYQDLQNITLLRKMEERREERLMGRLRIQERKKKLEEEKKKAEKLKADEKKRKEKENRRNKLEESREKQRLEEEKKQERMRAREKMRNGMKLAENHYNKYLVRGCGLRPWLLLMKIRCSQQQEAVDFFQKKLMRNVFGQLRVNVREQTQMKVRIAEEFYERTLKKNFLHKWLEFHKEKVRQNQVAVDWNDFKVTQRAFSGWLLFIQNEMVDYLNKKNVAVLTCERKLKMKYLKKLRDYPEIKKIEQAKELRKRRWRQRVKEILPDYHPIEITDLEKEILAPEIPVQ